MAKCEVCERTPLKGKNISWRGSQVTRRYITKQKPNVQSVRIEDNGGVRKAYVCTSCLRSNKVKRA